MINTVLFSDVSQYLRSTNDTIFKVFFFGLCHRVFRVERSIFRQQKLISFKMSALFTKNSMNGAAGRTLKEDI